MMLMPLVFVSLPQPLFLIVTRTSTTETDNLSVGWLWAVSYSTWLCCLYNCHWYSFWRLTLVGGFFCLLFFLALLPLQLSLIIFLRLTLVGGCFCLLFFLALLPLLLPSLWEMVRIIHLITDLKVSISHAKYQFQNGCS